MGNSDCDDGSTCSDDRCEGGVCLHYATPTAGSTCPWPAESHTDAVNLTDIEGPIPNGFYGNLSGAVWNPVSRTLWLVENGDDTIWAVVEDGDGFAIAQPGGTRAEWNITGDLEGITQADFTEENVIYVMNEAGGLIHELDMSDPTNPVMNNTWNLGAIVGPSAEAITFVPDEFLTAQGFVADDGSAYVSTRGMGGLMLVGEQGAGQINAFDLDRTTGEFVHVGRYATGRDETAGLEFDRSTGVLYIWHDAGYDELELVHLSSTTAPTGPPRLDTIITYSAPELGLLMSSNREGIALAPISDCKDGLRSLWMTTDGGKLWSLTQFIRFPC